MLEVQVQVGADTGSGGVDAPSTSTVSTGNHPHARQNPSALAKSVPSINLAIEAPVPDSRTYPRGPMPSGRTTSPDPVSTIITSPESDERAGISYEAYELTSSRGDVEFEEEKKSDALPSTPLPRRKPHVNKWKQQTPKENEMFAITPSTRTTDRSSTDPFINERTPTNDNPIPIDLSGSRKGQSPDLETGSSSASSAPSTPTKAPVERRGPVCSRPNLISHSEAFRNVRRVVVEINATKAEYKRVRGLYEHLLREENATPMILEETVNATSRRLMRAVEDDEKVQAGNRPRHVPYSPEMIAELLTAVEKAEVERDNWYAETERLFWLFDRLEKEKMPMLRLKLDAARKEEAAARQREGVQAGAVACQRPVAPSGMPSGTGVLQPFPTTARRIRQGETLIASPVFSDASSHQVTIVRGIRKAMRRATDTHPPETPTNTGRR